MTTLVVTGSPHSDWRAVLDLIVEGGATPDPESETLSAVAYEQRNPKDLQRVDSAGSATFHSWGAPTVNLERLADISDLAFVLVFVGPDREIGSHLFEGGDPDRVLEVLRTWLRATRSQLAFFQRNRGRAVLVEADRVLRDPSALAHVLEKRLSSSKLTLSQEPNEFDHVWRLVGLMCDPGLAEARLLIEEVRAAGDLVTDVASDAQAMRRDTIAKGVHHYLQMQATARMLLDERETVREQQVRLQEELDRSLATMADEREIADLRLDQIREELLLYFDSYTSANELLERVGEYLPMADTLRLTRHARALSGRREGSMTRPERLQ
jgi:hypothetical protein